MKRTLVLGIIVVAGMMVAATGALVAQEPAGRGQEQGRGGGGRGGAGGAPIGEIQKVADNLYMIPGAGGNTAVYIAAKGVVLVDTKLANNGQAILDQVKKVTDRPITHIINTHTHGDHNGSNVFFPATVEIVAHENTAANMQKMPAFQDAANKHGLPDRTYKDRLSLLGGSDAIDLYYFGAAHTNGDTFVLFRNARTVHAGDVFAGKQHPLIDRNNGGSGVAYPDTLAKAVKTFTGSADTVITGHSTVMKLQDMADYAEFNRLVLAHARESMKMGKTPEQAFADFKPGDRFKDYNLGPGRGGPGGNFTIIYEELKQGR